MRVACGVGVLSMAVAITTPGVGAQTLTGRVLEDGREIPVAGAAVSLLDRDGKHRAGATSDSLGRFTLKPPGTGEYLVEVVSLGYETTRSPLLALDGRGTATVDLLVRPSPLGLAGLEVTVEDKAEALLQTMGHTPAELGNRWISRAKLAKMPPTYGPAEAILASDITGIMVQPTNGIMSVLCVMFRRARTAMGVDRCALVFLNGIRVSLLEAQNLRPDEIESIAVLTPTDANTFFGGDAGGGAVLLWTRNGRR